MASVSRRIPEMRLLQLSREWFRWSLAATAFAPDSAHGQLLTALRAPPARQHGDMRRTLHGQEAIRRSAKHRNLSEG